MERRDWMAPLAAAAGAGMSGIAGAIVRRPWHDEIYTLELARRPVSAILQALHLDSGPPGYYLLCHLANLGGADSVRALRLLSVFPIMLVAALAADTWREPRARWAAAVLVALHPLLLAAAADARPYALVTALAAAVAWIVFREPTRPNTAGLALALGAACWIHSLGIILVAAVFLTGVFMTGAARRRILLGTLGGLILQLPWLPVMVGQPAASLQWMVTGWAAQPVWWRPLLPLTQPGPVALRTPFVDLWSPPLLLAAMGTLLWLSLAGTGAATRPKARVAAGVWVFAGAGLVLGTALLRPIYAPGQADKMLVPFAVAVVAAAAIRSRTALAAILVLGVLGGWVSGATLHSWSTAPPRPEEEAAAAIAARARPGDLVITTSWWYLGVRHSLGRRARRLRWTTFPLDTARHPGWYDDHAAINSRRDLTTLRRRIVNALNRGHRAFLLRSPTLPSDRLLDALAGAAGLVPVAAEPPYWTLWEGPAKPRTRRQTAIPTPSP